MMSKDIEAELERQPFVPIKLHLVSGKEMTIRNSNAAWMMQNTLVILRHPRRNRLRGDGYDVVSNRNIERIEQLTSRRSNGH